MSNYVNDNGVSEMWTNTKNYITAQLLGKSNVGHTHTMSDVTDLPSADTLPIGSYIQFAGSQAPVGFLVCNGGAVSRTTYSELFAVIGTTYGSGDGSTTFNLPNLTDRFLQGSSTSGTVKNAGLPNITGDIISVIRGDTRYGGVFGIVGIGWQKIQFGSTSASGSLIITDAQISFSANSSNQIYGNSTTVQPPALTCLICIKY